MALRLTGDVAMEVVDRLIRDNGFIRFDVIIPAEAAARLNEAASLAGNSPRSFIADLVKAAFPSVRARMNLTVLTRLEVCADDLLLLDRMAAAAVKTRDVVMSDIVFHALTEERQFRKRMEDLEAQYGTHSDCQA